MHNTNREGVINVKYFISGLIIIFAGALFSCTKSVSDTYAVKSEGNGAAELERTVERQQETIKELQAKISEQQERITQGETGKNAQKKDDPVAKAIRDSWTCCKNRKIEVSDGVVKIYFASLFDFIGFVDTEPDNDAHSDLDVFLKTSGLKTGVVEYRMPPPNGKKMFSISGSLSNAEITRHW